MKIKLAIIQSAFSKDQSQNNERVMELLSKASAQGAQVAVIPELYLSHYFCKNQDDKHFSMAHELESHPYLSAMTALCQKLSLVLPFSFYEKSGPHYFNSVAMIDADGKILGVYRKSHIPDGPGYQEKYYFRPGNTGFKVFKTAFGSIGVGICWDQWFPEAARIMVLRGAELLLYPTAIGSEPNNPDLNTKEPWQRVMQGHAVANMIPIAAANRIGTEDGQTFYGASFIADEFGSLVCEMKQDESGFRVFELDLARANKHRASFGFFRDRRIDLYGELLK